MTDTNAGNPQQQGHSVPRHSGRESQARSILALLHGCKANSCFIADTQGACHRGGEQLHVAQANRQQNKTTWGTNVRHTCLPFKLTTVDFTQFKNRDFTRNKASCVTQSTTWRGRRSNNKLLFCPCMRSARNTMPRGGPPGWGFPLQAACCCGAQASSLPSRGPCHPPELLGARTPVSHLSRVHLAWAKPGCCATKALQPRCPAAALSAAATAAGGGGGGLGQEQPQEGMARAVGRGPAAAAAEAGGGRSRKQVQCRWRSSRAAAVVAAAAKLVTPLESAALCSRAGTGCAPLL